MKKISMFLAVLFILLGALPLSACNVAAQPVQALAITEAPVTVAVPSDTAVALPVPTETVDVASATPSRIELAVSNGNMQVKVVNINKPFSVYLGQDPILGTDVRYTAGPGNMFLDIGIKVTNMTGSDIPMKWSEIYMSNKHGDKWYPRWAGYRELDGLVDPLTMEILKYDQVHPDYDPDAHFYVGDDGFIRMIFQLPRTNLYYFFGFGELQQIEIKNIYY